MKLVAIETSNFKALAGKRDYADIPDGIIGITGDNGKGKSTLMTAVAYAFYGPEAIETGNADVVTWGEKKAWVNVWFTLDGGTYMVHRGSDGKNSEATLVRAGEPIAQSASEVTAEITRLLGIDRVGFHASVFSKQEDLLGIGSLQPAKRQSTVLRLLGIDQVDGAIKKLSESTRDLNKELNLTRTLSQKPERGMYTADFIRESEDILEKLGSKDHDIDAAIDETITVLKELEASVNTYNEWARVGNELDVERRTLREQQRGARADAAKELPPKPRKPNPYVEPNEFLVREREYENVKKSVAASVCPTCKRPYDAEEAIAIKTQANLLGAWVEQNTPHYEKVLDYEANLERYEREAEYKANATMRAESITLKVDELDAKIILHAASPVENPLQAHRDATATLRKLDQQKADVHAQIARMDSDLTHAKRSLATYEENVRKYSEQEARINGLERQVLIGNLTSKLMTEYKQQLIANVVPSITEKASALITEMTEGKYTEVALTPEYDIEYRNDQGDLKSFANLSGGEKDVFALALRLAIADIKAGSVGILVLDEVLESLDTGRQEAVWEALERLSNRYNQVFVITHVDAFKDRAPHALSV